MAFETKYFDLKPVEAECNYLFTDMVNIKPVAHPFTGLGHRRNMDINWGDKKQFWFDKREGLRKAQLFKRDGCQIIEEFSDPDGMLPEELEWYNGEFTDSVIYKGTRWFMRVNQRRDKMKIYVYYPPVSEECSGFLYDDTGPLHLYDITSGLRHKYDHEEGTYDTVKGPNYFEFDQCCYDRFLLTQGPSRDSYDPYDMNKDPQSTGRSARRMNIKFFYYNYNIYAVAEPYGGCQWDPMRLPKDGEILHVNGTSTYIAGRVPPAMAAEFELCPHAVLLDTSTLTNVFSVADEEAFGAIDSLNIEKLNDKYGTARERRQLSIHDVYATLYDRYDESLYFVDRFGLNQVDNFVDAIRNFSDPNDAQPPCIWFDYHSIKQTQSTDGSIITGLTEYLGNSIAYITSSGVVRISRPGLQNHVFPLNSWLMEGGNITNDYPGMYVGYNKYTDVLQYYGYLVFIGGHDWAYYTPGSSIQAGGAYKVTDKSGYFNPRSWSFKDGLIHCVRSYGDLYNVQTEASNYTYTKFVFSYESQHINSHLRNLNHETDKCHVDLTDNNSYISIYDNNRYVQGDPSTKHYSKLLIQDRQYNFWYTRLFNGARVTRVIDNIFLGDWVYTNTGKRDAWSATEEGEYITEIISGQWGDETLQANKHLVNAKVAVGYNSHITDNTIVDSNVLCDGKRISGSHILTVDRYPNLLRAKEAQNSNGDPAVIHKYMIGEEIFADKPQLKHNFQNEMLSYKNYEATYKPLQLNNKIQDMDLKSTVGRFSPIGIPFQQLGSDADMVQFVISAQKDDNVEFGGYFLGYYENDFDRTDIANMTVEPSEFTYATENMNSLGVPHGEYDEEILTNNFS